MDDAPLWIFGYGSLMWNPGFHAAERQIARLTGYRRSFCMASVHYRGTPDAPGLVLALEEVPGAACDGVAFRVEPGLAEPTRAYLRARELISDAYLEAVLPVRLTSGAQVTALAYVMNQNHTQYRGGLSPAEQAAIIARACGQNGTNRDYLHSTADHLAELGLHDPELVWLAGQVDKVATTSCR